MDVNQVKFGNYSIGSSGSGAANNSKENASEAQTQNTQAQAQGINASSADSILNALGIAGMQNLAFISKTEPQAPNPADYLDENRISDIEAAMAGFESGVDNIANVLDAEFPGMFADDQKLALAAQIFAAE